MRTTEHLGPAADRAKLLRRAADRAKLRRERVATQLSGAMSDPAAVVRALLAVQAQDYRASLWAIALRTPEGTEADVERAIEARAIVRTWPMRGTLHFVPAEDARWMLRLLAPRVITKSAARHRELGLDEAVFARAGAILEGALSGGRRLTRPALFALLEEHGIATASQRGVHVLGVLSMRGLLCHGPHEGKQPTFVLLDEWVPGGAALEGDEALVALARRYVAGHGPATTRDFAWWTGLPLGTARRALELAGIVADEGGMHRGDATREIPAPRVHLLPPFDEYTVGYQDRSAILDPAHAARTRNGIMSPVVVIEGRIAGVWSRAAKKGEVVVRIELFAPVARSLHRELERAAARYGAFLACPARLDLTAHPS